MSSPDRERINVYAGEHDIEIKRENPAQSDIEGIKEIPAESTKGSISLSKQSPVDNFKFIIKSVPQGVEVYHTSVVESNFLGKTPIELDINQYSSKRIILVGNGKTKSFYLNQNQKEYEIRLDDIDNVYQNNRAEILEKQENKREESNSAPSANFSKNFKVYIIILLLIIIALLSWFILSNTLTSRYVPDNDHSEENIKDSEEILMDTISTELPQNTNTQKSLILTDTVGVSKEDTKNELLKYNDYYIIDNENIKIRQYLDKFDYTYFEFIELPKEHLVIFKTYHQNGMIKRRGRSYMPGGINIGTWEYFNEKGEFIKQEEYNYKMPLEKALRIIRRIYGYKQENLTVYLSADKERWYFENIKGKKKGKMAYIDMVTKEHGEILVGTLVD